MDGKKKTEEREWLTIEIAEEYKRKAQVLPDNGRQDIGQRRKLREELQHRYGLTELEALEELERLKMLVQDDLILPE